MVIRLGAGPTVSLSDRCLIRRLLGPADWWGPTDWLGVEPTGRVHRGRVLPAADCCSHASNDAGLVMGPWQQLRRLAGDHCCHSLSRLVNGAWGPWEGLADSWGPTGGALAVFCTPADWWDPSSLGRTGKPSWAQDFALWG